MNVLMITGDRNLLRKGSDAWKRLEMQRTAVHQLDVVYWGRGAFFSALFARGEYDVVTAQDPLWRGLVGVLLARKLDAKLNVQVHMDLSSLSFVRHILAQIVLRHADTVRVVSEKIKRQVERMGTHAKIAILPVYVDLQRFSATKRRAHDGKNILWVGRLEDEKNPLLAVDVLREVLKTIPDAKLILLGSGSLKSALQRAARGLPVTFEGWQDPCAFLATADVVLSTSRHEAWGASIIEALAAGVPVVAPDVGAAKEAGAFVVAKEDLAAATAKILREGGAGVLTLELLPAQQWARTWQSTLI